MGLNTQVRALASGVNSRFVSLLNTLNSREEVVPTGIVMIDFAGADNTNGVAVKGLQVVNQIIAQNQWLKSSTPITTPNDDPHTSPHIYRLDGTYMGKGPHIWQQLGEGVYVIDGKKVAKTSK